MEWQDIFLKYGQDRRVFKNIYNNSFRSTIVHNKIEYYHGKGMFGCNFGCIVGGRPYFRVALS